jgi:hypothetical protein
MKEFTQKDFTQKCLIASAFALAVLHIEFVLKIPFFVIGFILMLGAAFKESFF